MNAFASCWVSGVLSSRLLTEWEEEEGIRGRKPSDRRVEPDSANRTERGMECLRRPSGVS